MGETEVTQELFEAVMGTNPSYFQGDPHPPVSGEVQAKRPVEWVSWYDAIAFCNKLSLKDGRTPVYSVAGFIDWAALAYASIPRTGYGSPPWNAMTMDPTADGYRLPTEMQWMWAAMGATKGGTDVAAKGYKKDFAGDANMDTTGQSAVSYAWHIGNANNKTHEVGKKLPNELGIYDMSGNVREYCWDWYDDSYGTGLLTDYTGPELVGARVVRGGSHNLNAQYCAVGSRLYSGANGRVRGQGFRIVCP
jgi:formylglycine-generating enzyme required for sulfatase activity